MEKFNEKPPAGEAPKDENGETPEWEKEMEDKKKEHQQEDELDKLLKKMEKEKEEKNPYQRKKPRR